MSTTIHPSAHPATSFDDGRLPHEKELLHARMQSCIPKQGIHQPSRKYNELPTNDQPSVPQPPLNTHIKLSLEFSE
jgi:hypothetical protein